MQQDDIVMFSKTTHHQLGVFSEFLMLQYSSLCISVNLDTVLSNANNSSSPVNILALAKSDF